MGERVIVIGGTAAGLSAASKAKRVRPDLEIEVYERTGYISYGACGLPYFVGGMIDDPDELVSLFPHEMSNKRGIPTFTHHEVTAIDRAAKNRVRHRSGHGAAVPAALRQAGDRHRRRPRQAGHPRTELDGVYYLRTVEDGIRLKGALAARRRIAILGGGFIGLEMAEELTQAGAEVTVFEQLPRLLPFLDESFSQAAAQTLERHGVRLFTGTALAAIHGADGRVTAVETSDGQRVEVDGVLISIGVRPGHCAGPCLRPGAGPEGRHCGGRTPADQRPCHLGLRRLRADAPPAHRPAGLRPPGHHGQQAGPGGRRGSGRRGGRFPPACWAPWSPRSLSCTSRPPACPWNRPAPPAMTRRSA